MSRTQTGKYRGPSDTVKISPHQVYLLRFTHLYSLTSLYVQFICNPHTASPVYWSLSLTPGFFFFFLIFIYLFLWLCWVFVSVRGLSLVVASGGHSSSRCAGLSLSRPLLLRSTGSRRTDSVIVAHGPSCSAACGIFPEQGSNPCPLH